MVFIVGYIDFFNHELVLEEIIAESWQTAVVQHSLYPFRCHDREGIEEGYIKPQDAANLNHADMPEEEGFKQACFDCDSMMSWIEVLAVPKGWVLKQLTNYLTEWYCEIESSTESVCGTGPTLLDALAKCVSFTKDR